RARGGAGAGRALRARRTRRAGPSMASAARGTRCRGCDRDTRVAQPIALHHPPPSCTVLPVHRRRSPSLPESRHQPLSGPRPTDRRCARTARHGDAGTQSHRRPLQSVPSVSARSRSRRAGHRVAAPCGARCARLRHARQRRRPPHRRALPRPGPGVALGRDRDVVCRLRELADGAPDPKAALLERLLAGHAGKTIVFVPPRATVRYLLRRLQGLRVAAVVGDAGLFGAEAASRAEVLAAFAPLAQRAPPPVPALETDVLIATDLLSEGLNLQDATRVVHYDLPWTPARLAQ